MNSARALSSIYTMAILATFIVFSMSVFTVYTSRAIKVNAVLAERASYYPLLSVYFKEPSYICVNTTDPFIKEILVDQGSIVKKLLIDNNYAGDVCTAILPSKPAAVVVVTEYGGYVYTPSRDPLYAMCAPPIQVFKPEQLSYFKSLCADNDSRGLPNPAAVANYLDPVFTWYLGPIDAEKYRGLVPYIQNYTTMTDIGLYDYIVYRVLNNNIVWDKSISDVDGIAVLTGGASSYVLELCRYVEKMPYIERVCVPYVVRGYNLGLRPNYTEAYHIKIPLINVVIARFPGFWLLIGNGSTMSIVERGTAILGHYYSEATVVTDDGSVIPLVWSKVGSPCTPRTVEVNGWKVSNTCRFIQTFATPNIPVIELVDPTGSFKLEIPYNYTGAASLGVEAGYRITALPTTYVRVKGKLHRFPVWGEVRDILYFNETLFSEREDTRSVIIFKDKYVVDDPYGSRTLWTLNMSIVSYKK